MASPLSPESQAFSGTHPHKVCVLGATGRTGKAIVEALYHRGIPLRAGVRSLQRGREVLGTIPGISLENLELVEVNILDHFQLDAALTGCDGVICAAGATPSLAFWEPFAVDYWGIINLVNIAQKHSLQHLVLVSSLCVSRFLHPLNLLWLILFWKKLAEQAIEVGGIPYTIIRPGGLLSAPRTDDPYLRMTGADQLFEGRIARSQVAEVVATSLFLPEAYHKIVEIIYQPEPVSPYHTIEEALAQVECLKD
jgi:uncharacterized protein YbjT (DUF2867 family)